MNTRYKQRIALPDNIVDRIDVVCPAGPLGAKLQCGDDGIISIRSLQSREDGTPGPAEAAGVEIGDVLVAINGQTVAFSTYKQVLQYIRSVPRPCILRFGKVVEGAEHDDGDEDSGDEAPSAAISGFAPPSPGIASPGRDAARRDPFLGRDPSTFFQRGRVRQRSQSIDGSPVVRAGPKPVRLGRQPAGAAGAAAAAAADDADAATAAAGTGSSAAAGPGGARPSAPRMQRVAQAATGGTVPRWLLALVVAALVLVAFLGAGEGEPADRERTHVQRAVHDLPRADAGGAALEAAAGAGALDGAENAASSAKAVARRKEREARAADASPPTEEVEEEEEVDKRAAAADDFGAQRDDGKSARLRGRSAADAEEGEPPEAPVPTATGAGGGGSGSGNGTRVAATVAAAAGPVPAEAKPERRRRKRAKASGRRGKGAQGAGGGGALS